MYDRCWLYIKKLQIEQQKLARNSNGYNFSLGCPIQAHNISRRSKFNKVSSWAIQMVITFHSNLWFTWIIYRVPRNWIRKLSTNSNIHNLWLECMIHVHDILRRSKLNNGISREIQMAITFNSDVRFTRLIYRDPRNWTRKLSANQNGHNFWLESMIDVDNISRRSKLNNGSSRHFRMVITFHSDVRFGDIIYRDARNWTTEALAKFEWS